MKQEYLYSKGKIKTLDIDKRGCLKNIVEYDYQDNIEDILITENIIEELQNKKINISQIKNNNTDNLNKLIKRKKTILLATAIISIIGLISLLSAFSFNNFIVPNILKYFSIIYITFIPGTLISTSLSLNSDKKRIKNEINGCNLELEKIEEKLEINKNILIDLKNNNSKENEEKETNDLKKVDYVEKLKELKKYLYLYYQIGFHENELSKYYKKGTLDENLKGKYNDNEMQLIKTYLKSK